MSATPPELLQMAAAGIKEVSNGNEKEYRSRGGDKERSKSKDRSRDKDKDREREKKKRDRDRESRDRDRESRRRESRDRSRSRNHEDYDGRRRKRSRSKERRRDRDSRRSRRSGSRGGRDDYDRSRESRSRRSSSRGGRDEYDRNRRRRSRSRSYERRRRDRSREPQRSTERSSRERTHVNPFETPMNSIMSQEQRLPSLFDRQPQLETIREEPRDSRFDLSQTIQELMCNSSANKSFASLFNSQNSNDSTSNGPSDNSMDSAAERKRKRKSRWGGTENDKTFIPGMPTILPSTLDPAQQEAYLVQFQIEEISRKLRTGDLGITQNPEERSPSPEPIYSSDGKRLNTREFRYRKRLEEQRHQLILKMQAVNPEFKPPADYKPPVTRVSDKVLIPQEQYPDINFVGLLIGPRGNTLKAMEKETGAKIIIRGKGSVKEGKVGRKDGQPLPGEDEPLHAFITAPSQEAVKKAVDKIKDVIRQGIETPEGHNDLRRMQLRELAQLNGTLRENDIQRCTCGSTDHKSWQCPEKPIITNTIVCTSCGGAGHLTKDCRSKRPGAGGPGMGPCEDSQAKIDEEYMSLMAELGEGPPPSVPKADAQPAPTLHRSSYSIFDKKPSQMQAIQSPPSSTSRDHQRDMGGSGWGSAPPTGNGMGMSAYVPTPPVVQAPPPMPPPLMPWMSAPQPPPPASEPMNPPIPGTMSPLIPPPPGTSNPPMPPWSSGPPGMMHPGGYGGWGAGYPPPPPPPCAPPPPALSLAQPPPPPPPSN
ncbi:splicing factor 1 [Scaptodrosophila lebanonensis]|uniref:Branchpoint-bridging protein n=1 Tax=Drosophila lebanonensis TaxID=7225 RepID=A0A6J2T9P2_DROLE|nr:splicing factor 1 [Scaptodrosophila lebanonensis]